MLKILNDALIGEMKLCYITEVEGKKRLTVWFEAEQSGNMLDVYTHRFISYDLGTGRKLGSIDPVERDYRDDFSWYGPFGVYAWGYSEDTNLILMDLYRPQIIYDKDDILSRNPELGPAFKLAPYKHPYGRNGEIAVATAGGDTATNDGFGAVEPNTKTRVAFCPMWIRQAES